MRRVWGYFVVSHAGGAAVGVPRDDGDVVFGGEGDGVVEPGEVKVAVRWLEGGPGELGDADDVHVSVLHELEVGIPALLRPLLRVPGCSEERSGWLLCGRSCSKNDQ